MADPVSETKPATEGTKPEEVLVPVPKRLQEAFGLAAEVPAQDYERIVMQSTERKVLETDFMKRTEVYAVAYREALERSATESNAAEVADKLALLERELQRAIEEAVGFTTAKAGGKNDDLQKQLDAEAKSRDFKFDQVDSKKLVALVAEGMEEKANELIAKRLKAQRDKTEKGEGELAISGEHVDAADGPDVSKLPPPPKPKAKGKAA